MVNLKNISIEYRVAILLVFISIILLLRTEWNILSFWDTNKAVIIKTLYLTALATLISTLIHFSLPSSLAESHLNKNKISFLFYATILGILTPGPVYSIYPIVIELKNKGIKYPLLVSYLTGQTIIGPARIPFELGYFGIKFFLYRLMLSLLIGPITGGLYILISKVIKDD